MIQRGNGRSQLCEQLGSGPGRNVEAGELLYTMGQPAESVYLVRRGLMKTSLVSPGGQEVTLRLYPAGDILGELCLCTGERREQAVALETRQPRCTGWAVYAGPSSTARFCSTRPRSTKTLLLPSSPPCSPRSRTKS